MSDTRFFSIDRAAPVVTRLYARRSGKTILVRDGDDGDGRINVTIIIFWGTVGKFRRVRRNNVFETRYY